VSDTVGPENLRVYGLMIRDGRVLMSAETVAGREILKFPGGGVEAGETPEAALVREFVEECGLTVAPTALLHAPGTLFSPWTHANYSPLYYKVAGDGDPVVPDHEPIEMSFMDPGEAVASGRMAEPEKVALARALLLRGRHT
jgi:8-oxo-dGTP pyrophosphatase MutT (NUDIX family)